MRLKKGSDNFSGRVDMSEQAVSGIRVLDLADAKGVYGTRILAGLGADVIKVEPPEGDAMRKIPPLCWRCARP